MKLRHAIGWLCLMPVGLIVVALAGIMIVNSPLGTAIGILSVVGLILLDD